MGNVFDAEYRTTPVDLLQRFHSDLHGKTALITGCTSGMGPELARALASAGATVFICGRDEGALSRVRDELNAELKATGKAESVQSLLFDLSSFRSVQAAAAEFLRRSQRLHLLILNAGLMQQPWRQTEDGLESMFQVSPSVRPQPTRACAAVAHSTVFPASPRPHCFPPQVNYAAHWLLFHLLKDALVASAPARVVVVASAAFWMFGKPQMDYSLLPPQPLSAARFDSVTGYQQSKLADVLFAQQINALYASKGVHAFAAQPVTHPPRAPPPLSLSPVQSLPAPSHVLHSPSHRVLSLLPISSQGAIQSPGLLRNSPGWQKSLFWLTTPLWKDEKQGASTALYCAVAPGIEADGGRYFNNCKVDTKLERTNIAPAEAPNLWEWTEKFIDQHIAVTR